MLSRFRALTADERRLAAEIAVTTLGVAAALRVLPFTEVLRRARRQTRRRRRMRVPAARVAVLVDGIGRRIPGSTCLVKALVLFTVLARRGVAAEIVVGATRRCGAFAAHAWLRHDDAMLLGGSDADAYALLVRLCPSHASIATAA